MEKRYLTPKEVAQATIKSGVAKANLKSSHMLILGVFAGMFIGFGAYGDIIIMQTLKNIDVGLMKFFGALVFPVGLMLVVMAGAELFTGNNLMTLAVMDKKITLKQMLKNWVLVYTGNFIGSVLLVFVLLKANLFSESAANLSISIAKAKMSLPMGVLFLRAILCNVIVVLSVWMATAAQDVVSKIFACWFPIMLFVLSGYEHSIANMFFIPMGKAFGLSMSWIDIFTVNLLPVTLGNIVGGGLIVPIAYYICYVKKSKEEAKNI
ncbi:formate/nitrite transporter family protein [Tepidibacter aestuarii]|uniref:formate/nitrite transporter family protein n=1 Tax=Tepidibacter aestuarii TaxID=2925782 RepID=UPI0020BE485D|nr:formate/nitrite transporter family protein [Tepidibacter aestuarii]CAH2214848.1 formate transporter [Tepidibacter aestuarii]